MNHFRELISVSMIWYNRCWALAEESRSTDSNPFPSAHCRSPFGSAYSSESPPVKSPQALHNWTGAVYPFLLGRSSQAPSDWMGSIYIAILRSLHRCWMGFKSGLWLKSWMPLQHCLGPNASGWESPVACTLEKVSLLDRPRVHVPAAETLLQRVMLPPPRFTAGTALAGWWVAPRVCQTAFGARPGQFSFCLLRPENSFLVVSDSLNTVRPSSLSYTFYSHPTGTEAGEHEEKVLVLPNFFHFVAIEDNGLLGPLFINGSITPDLCRATIMSWISMESSLDFIFVPQIGFCPHMWCPNVFWQGSVVPNQTKCLLAA